MNGALPMPARINGAIPPHEPLMPDATQRILDKLDVLQASQATLAAEQARIQGSQDGIRMSVQTLSNAIGDVTEMKVDAKGTSAQIVALTDRLTTLEKSLQDRDWRMWVERLISGGIAVSLAEGLRRLL